jgi:hypothetical protein
MATYYKYAEREADSFVDWGAIGKSMSDMLLEKDKIRNEKRAALDEASRQFGEVLANAPQGEHKAAREMALEYASNASQFMRMQDILLKSGQMDLRDYTIARQNILDDTDRAFKMNEAYQKMFKEKMERYKKKDSSYYEVQGMERVEGFGNFSQSGLWINPTTGKVSVAMKDLQKINGQDVYVMAENPNNMTSIDAINGLILGKWDRYDSEAATTALAEMNGKQIQSMMGSGAITKIEDILNKPDYINAETNYINAALGGSDSFDRVSLLTDSMIDAPNGKQYRFTRDEADAKANPEAILMKINPASGQESPQISDEQMKDSTEWMRTRARSKYDYEKTINQKQQRQYDPNAAAAASTQKQQELDAGSWNAILMAQTAQDKKNAAEAVLASPGAQARGLIGITVNDNGTVSLTYADAAKNTTFDIAPGGVPISLEDWAKKGAEVHGVSDQQRAIRAGGFYGQEASTDFMGVTAKRQGPTTTAAPANNPNAKASLDNTISSLPSAIFGEKETEAAAALTTALAPYNIKVTKSGGAITNYVTVQIPGKPSVRIGTNAYTSEGEQEFKDALINYINENLPDNASVNAVTSAAGDGVGAKYNQ